MTGINIYKIATSNKVLALPSLSPLFIYAATRVPMPGKNMFRIANTNAKLYGNLGKLFKKPKDL